MQTIHNNYKEAMQAAKDFQKENGGIIFEGITETLTNFQNVILGTYGAIVVGTGEGSEPFGDSWESFHYEL